MPELPEVETIRQQLEKKLKGKKIQDVTINNDHLINVPASEFKDKLKGAKIKEVKRRAKLLIIDLDNDYSLLVHLKLTGNLIYNGRENDKADICFILGGGDTLAYRDKRKLGYMKLLRSDLAEDTVKAQNFGPEILSEDFTLEKFEKIFSLKKKSKIKPLLMDQKVLAGIGNIYSQEACFRAKINPQRLAGSLTKEEITLLYNELKKILTDALKYHGSSVDSYLDIYGRKGKFVSFLQVYNRKGEPCLKCKTPIKMIKMNGRGTYFCPKCQK